jgi:hypothetical protein
MKYPSKSGGPDRRFKDNCQIPICRYEVVHFKSRSGVNELVEFSKIGVAQPFRVRVERFRPMRPFLSSRG